MYLNPDFELATASNVHCIINLILINTSEIIYVNMQWQQQSNSTEYSNTPNYRWSCLQFLRFNAEISSRLSRNWELCKCLKSMFFDFFLIFDNYMMAKLTKNDKTSKLRMECSEQRWSFLIIHDKKDKTEDLTVSS